MKNRLKTGVVLGLLAIAGCDIDLAPTPPKPPPKLTINAIGIDENQTPLLLGLDVTNSGNTTVNAVAEPEFIFTYLVADRAGRADITTSFDAQVGLAGGGVVLMPGDQAVLDVVASWGPPSDFPMLAICELRIHLHYDTLSEIDPDTLLTDMPVEISEPVMFVLAGDSESREAILSGSFDHIEGAKLLADKIESEKCKKSKGILRLIKALRGEEDSSPTN